MKRSKSQREAAWKPPELTHAQILAWADAYHERTGRWPSVALGTLPIPDSSGEQWRALDCALRKGYRGLPKGSSLARLLAKHRGARNRKGLPRLTRDRILAWADAYHEINGRWPRQDTIPGAIPESPGENWKNIDDSLRRGLRGLAGGDSLARLLAERRGVRNMADLPNLTERQILDWADAFHDRTGRWPGQRVWKEAILDSGGETWLRIDQALKIGIRGLPGGKTLSDLLALHGRVRNPGRLPRLTEERILEWADAYRQRTGFWPQARCEPQLIEDTFGEVWFNVDQALRKGLRGLPGQSSLARLLALHRDVPNPKTKSQAAGS